MPEFVRRWADWDRPHDSPSVPSAAGRKLLPESPRVAPLTAVVDPRTALLGTDKTDKRASVGFVGAQDGHSEVDRCDSCLHLADRGIAVLLCSECGYSAPREVPEPTPDDLKYPLDYVHQQVPSLPQPYRARFDYFVDLFSGGGWSQEDAERAAFRRTLLSGPISKAQATDKQLHLATEEGSHG